MSIDARSSDQLRQGKELVVRLVAMLTKMCR
jgi:hypothetical protein